jgi:putative ABC transport system ATP-binding protein
MRETTASQATPAQSPLGKAANYIDQYDPALLFPLPRSAKRQELGLGERLQHTPAELSGGQQQRVAIARALVNDPVVVMADEPTGALDSRTSIEVMGLFQELNREGRTVIMVTHEQDVADHATRIIRFRDGDVVEDGPVINRRDAREELEELNRMQVAKDKEKAAKLASV